MSTSSSSARRVLNAFWRRGDVDPRRHCASSAPNWVLNAFWRRGDVDACAIGGRLLGSECSTPFGDGAMWTTARDRRHHRCSGVLNAFWRRGDVDLLWASDRDSRCGVLNAFWRRGDVDPGTSFTLGNEVGAQRLLATGRCGLEPAHGLSPVLTCSTPFGDGAMWTLWQPDPRWPIRRAQRLLATGRCGQGRW